MRPSPVETTLDPVFPPLSTKEVSPTVPENRLVAEPRTEFGKGAARRVRRANKVPAVLYGHGEKPRHVSLPGHETALILRGDANILLTLELDGTTELALPRAVVRDPIKGFLEHIDLLLVRKGERVSIELALAIVGDTHPGALPQLQLQTISVEAEATNLPESLEVSVEGLRSGSHITAGELTLPEGTTLLTDADAFVLTVFDSTLAAESEAIGEELAEEVAAEHAEAEEADAAAAPAADGESETS